MERFSFVFLVGGLGFFVLAFGVSAYIPWMQFQDLKVTPVIELVQNPSLDLIELRETYPAQWKAAFGDKTDGSDFAAALEEGRQVYIGEACWHCHSQQVRAVGGDEARFGRVSYPEEYNNDMNYPPIWGTRRIGPDLIRSSGRRSNDWHVAHFWNPRDVSPTSVMPAYPWFYEADQVTPNRKGLAIITYIQWLGSWEPTRNETIHAVGDIERSYEAPKIDRPAPKPPADAQPDTATDSDGGYGDKAAEDEGY